MALSLQKAFLSRPFLKPLAGDSIFDGDVLPPWGVVKWLRHRILIPAFGGSSPPAPARIFKELECFPVITGVYWFFPAELIRS